MATKTKLIFTPPSGTPAKYSLDRTGTYTVGTSESCDITIDDDQLAEEHGKLVADETSEARWFLQDIETGAIAVLEDGSTQSIGETKIDVSIEQFKAPAKVDESEEDEYEDDDEEYEDDDEEYEDDEEEDSAPSFSTDAPADNERQLEALKKAQQMREMKSAIILVIVCAILSFAAGVAVRLMK